MGDILVPVKGEPQDDEAVRLACRLAKNRKARVFVCYVIEVPRNLNLPLNLELPQEQARGQEALKRAEKVAMEERYRLIGELLDARDAGTALVKEAVEQGVELIVLGMPYRRSMGLFTLGDTVSYILKNAPCRVWLCREPMEETPTSENNGRQQ